MGRVPGDMRKLMQQAQQMQAQVQKAQEQLAESTYEAAAGGGAVVAVVKGSMQVESITFAEGILDPDDPELVGDLVVAAVNAALAKANEAASQALGGVGGGLDLGGLLGG